MRIGTDCHQSICGGFRRTGGSRPAERRVESQFILVRPQTGVERKLHRLRFAWLQVGQREVAGRQAGHRSREFRSSRSGSGCRFVTRTTAVGGSSLRTKTRRSSSNSIRTRRKLADPAADANLIEHTGKAGVQASGAIADRQRQRAGRDRAPPGCRSPAQRLAIAIEPRRSRPVISDRDMLPCIGGPLDGIRKERLRVVTEAERQLQPTHAALDKGQQQLVVVVRDVLLAQQVTVPVRRKIGRRLEPQVDRERTTGRQVRLRLRHGRMSLVFNGPAGKRLQTAAEFSRGTRLGAFQLQCVAVPRRVLQFRSRAELPQGNHVSSAWTPRRRIPAATDRPLASWQVSPG